MEEITRYVNLPVYTSTGTFVGNVKNVVLDVSNRKLDALLLGKTNPKIIEGGVDVAVPYRWVRAYDDIMILAHFPLKVAQPQEADAAEADEEQTEEPVAAAH